jgi:hypothetical protein
LGPQFDARRTKEAQGDASVLFDSHISASVPSGSTHFDVIMSIARSSTKPFRVKFLSEKLNELKLLRGRTCFGDTADQIAQIVSNYSSLRWWVTKEGLVVEEVLSELDSLPHFVRVAGALSLQHMHDGRISREAIRLIAEELDSEGFTLKEQLQPAEWKNVVAYNRKGRGRLVGSFASAVNDRRFVRFVRRSIYRARVRYRTALHHESLIS